MFYFVCYPGQKHKHLVRDVFRNLKKMEYGFDALLRVDLVGHQDTLCQISRLNSVQGTHRKHFEVFLLFSL